MIVNMLSHSLQSPKHSPFRFVAIFLLHQWFKNSVSEKMVGSSCCVHTLSLAGFSHLTLSPLCFHFINQINSLNPNRFLLCYQRTPLYFQASTRYFLKLRGPFSVFTTNFFAYSLPNISLSVSVRWWFTSFNQSSILYPFSFCFSS